MSFIPKNEQGLIALFFANIDKTNFTLVSIQTEFPDAILKMNGQEYRTEFEYQSSNFFKHNHNMYDCDLVICWKHNTNMIIPVVELSDPNWYLFDEKKIEPHIRLITKQSTEIKKLQNQVELLEDEVEKLSKKVIDSEMRFGEIKDVDKNLHEYQKTVSAGLSYGEKIVLMKAWVKKIERLPEPREVMERWGVSQATAYNYLKVIKTLDFPFLEN